MDHAGTDPVVMKALGHPLRLRILQALADHPRTVSRLADEMQLAPSKVLFHLRVLTKAGLIQVGETRQRGQVVEKRYALVSTQIHVPKAELHHAGARQRLHALAQEYLASAFAAAEPAEMPHPLCLQMGGVETNAAGLAELDAMIARLQAVRDKLNDLPEEVTYRFLVTLYPMKSEVNRP